MLTRRFTTIVMMIVASWAGSVVGVWAQAARTTDSVSLHGVGSTFAAPLYKKWIDEYGVSHPNVAISYDALGSGEGVKRFLAGTVDFAGSDEILSENEAAKVPGATMLPVTAGMIVLAYSIPGVNSEIKLPRDVYVDIFARKIRKWDDPRIQAANLRNWKASARRLDTLVVLSEPTLCLTHHSLATRYPGRCDPPTRFLQYCKDYSACR